MNYKSAMGLAVKSNEIAFTIIEDSIRSMPNDEFLKIEIIDDHTRIVAQKYGWCFTVTRNNDYTKCWKLYLLSSYLLREEKETVLTKQ